jgi:rSAM/selenodomain-associated transferase 1
MAELPLFAQMAREPIPGRVKTRLLPQLSPPEAAHLHALMVEHVCAVVCSSAPGISQLWVDGNPDAALFNRCRELGITEVLVQQGADLGQRMAHVCQQALKSHAGVILVGSDSPAIDEAYLASAICALEHADVTIGPALDGGYVLLGMRRFRAELFAGVHWGEDTVLAETLARVEELGWSCQLLEPLPDIDRPADLRFLPDTIRAALHSAAGRGAQPV